MKLSRLLIFVLSLNLVFLSCKKDEVQTDNNDNSQLSKGEIVNDPAPTQFTKKVLIEEFTGEWCGYCPDGASVISSIKQTHPGRVFSIAYHNGDPFSNSVCGLYEGLLNVPFYPSAAIDRVPYNGELSFSRAYWSSVTNNRLLVSADMGLKLETELSGNNLTVRVKFSATQDYTDLYLTLVLVENNVPESSPGAQAGAQTGYIHQDVFREMITDNRGDLITIVANKVVMVTYENIDLSAYDVNNVHIIALLHEKPDTPGKEVFNVQSVKAGEVKDFD